ncbi:hypothetical protein [Algicola sagamiensis]|uniref:hypothetical protein n=1 Tax=Algicola sagamiensis TaxID=163869 RepID=UPI000373C0B4|nr:hypothetical protein [Algicola sagamiensis]
MNTTLSSIFYCFCSSLLIFSHSIIAAPLDRLQSLIRDKQFADAELEAERWYDDFAGTPKFDFLLGQLYISQQKNQRAVFALERAVTEIPEWGVAKLYLAHAYFQSENLQLAREQVSSLLKDKQTVAALKDQASKMLELINKKELARKEITRQTFSIAFTNDSNATSGSEDNEVSIPRIGVIPNPAKDERDAFFNTTYRILYQKPITNLKSFQFSSGHSFVRYDDLNTLNRYQADIGVAYLDTMFDMNFSFGITYRPMQLQKSWYRNDWEGAISLNGSFTENLSWNAQVSYTDANNVQNDQLDMDIIRGAIGLSLKLGDHRFMINYSQTEEETDLEEGKHNGRETMQVGLFYFWLLNNQWLLTGNTSFQEADYNGKHNLFGIVRDEELRTTGVGLTYTANAANQLILQAKHTDKSSNIKMFSYKKIEFGLTWRHHF